MSEDQVMATSPSPRYRKRRKGGVDVDKSSTVIKEGKARTEKQKYRSDKEFSRMSERNVSDKRATRLKSRLDKETPKANRKEGTASKRRGGMKTSKQGYTARSRSATIDVAKGGESTLTRERSKYKTKYVDRDKAKSLEKKYKKRQKPDMAAKGLKVPGKNQKGLKKLPKEVRNKMGYAKNGMKYGKGGKKAPKYFLGGMIAKKKKKIIESGGMNAPDMQKLGRAAGTGYRKAASLLVPGAGMAMGVGNMARKVANKFEKGGKKPGDDKYTTSDGRKLSKSGRREAALKAIRKSTNTKAAKVNARQTKRGSKKIVGYRKAPASSRNLTQEKLPVYKREQRIRDRGKRKEQKYIDKQAKKYAPKGATGGGRPPKPGKIRTTGDSAKYQTSDFKRRQRCAKRGGRNCRRKQRASGGSAAFR